MNTNHFNWRVYCIVEQGKRALDKLLGDTKDAIRRHHIGQRFTLAEWAAMMIEAERQETFEKLKGMALLEAYIDHSNSLDKAFWRVNLSK